MLLAILNPSVGKTFFVQSWTHERNELLPIVKTQRTSDSVGIRFIWCIINYTEWFPLERIPTWIYSQGWRKTCHVIIVITKLLSTESSTETIRSTATTLYVCFANGAMHIEWSNNKSILLFEMTMGLLQSTIKKLNQYLKEAWHDKDTFLRDEYS